MLVVVVAPGTVWGVVVGLATFTPAVEVMWVLSWCPVASASQCRGRVRPNVWLTSWMGCMIARAVVRLHPRCWRSAVRTSPSASRNSVSTSVSSMTARARPAGTRRRATTSCGNTSDPWVYSVVAGSS